MSSESEHSQWMTWARELQAMSQTGLAFARDRYDVGRYTRLGQVAAEMVANHSNLPRVKVLEFHAAEFGYATPKVDVRGVVFHDDRILLVRELADGGRWTLPGGWADVNDSPSEAVIREIREEAGLVARPVKVLAVLDRELQGHPPPFPFHIYKIFFRCDWVGGELLANGDETGGSEFFAADALPELSLSRVTPAQIHRFFEHLRHPEMPTDFD